VQTAHSFIPWCQTSLRLSASFGWLMSIAQTSAASSLPDGESSIEYNRFVVRGGNLKKRPDGRHVTMFSALTVLLLISAGCTEDQPKGTPTGAASAPVSAAQVVSVSKDDVGEPWSGEDWPFTVPSGTVELVGCCSVVFRRGGTVYAVNGTARTGAEREGWVDFVDSGLWRDDPSGYGKVNIGPIIDLGLSLGERDSGHREVSSEVAGAGKPVNADTTTSRTQGDPVSTTAGITRQEESGPTPAEAEASSTPSVPEATSPNGLGRSDEASEGTEDENDVVQWLTDFMAKVASTPEITMWDLVGIYGTSHEQGGMWLEILTVIDDHTAEGRAMLEADGVTTESECTFVLENDFDLNELVQADVLFVVLPDLSMMTFQVGMPIPGERWLYSEDDYSIVLEPISE